jgi:hypothetical protein
MLNLEPKNLLEEIDYAEQVRDSKLSGVEESLNRYVGPDRAGPTSRSPAPENTEYEFVSYMSAVLAFDRPVISVESPIVSKQNDVMALEVGMNRWIRDTKLREQMALAVPDFCFAWAVYVTSRRACPELGEISFKDGNGQTRRGVPKRPYSKRLPFRQAFKDPLSTSPYDMRYAGHTEIVDKSNLVKQAESEPDAGWYLDKIKSLPTDSDLKRFGRRTASGNPTRDEIGIHRLWVADAEIDWEAEKIPEKDRELYHGMLFDICVELNDSGATGCLIRKPQPFFGPRWGPYTYIGANVVPDDAYFMSPMQPVRTSITMLNAVNDTADRAMANYKRLVFVNELEEDLADRVRLGKHDHVFTISAFERSMIEQVELGGVSNQMAAHLAMMKDKVDRNLGLSDVQRGAVSGQGSATEVALATQASSARMAVMERQWSYGHAQMLLTAAWYFWHDDEVAQPISIQEAMQIGVKMPEMVKVDQEGNPVLLNGQLQAAQQYVFGGTDEAVDTFDSLDLEILPYSMRRMSDQEQMLRTQFLQNYVLQMAPLVPMAPHIDWNLLGRTMAKLTGIQECKSIINLQAAADMAQSQVLAANAEQQAGDGPQMAKNAGGQAAQAPKPAALPSGGGGSANAAKPQNQPSPGRSAGGKQGNQAAQSAGAA